MEALRWYDISSLVSLCDKHLTGQKTSVMEYGMMLSVKLSMLHAANLAQFCRRSHSYCQVLSVFAELNQNQIKSTVDLVCLFF